MQAHEYTEKGSYLFVPSRLGEEAGLKVAAIAINKYGKFKLPVHNLSPQKPVRIDVGSTIGTVGQATILSMDQLQTKMFEKEEQYQNKLEESYRVQQEGLTNGRVDKLLDTLPFGSSATVPEIDLVHKVVRDFNDVFAVHEHELGDCNVVEVEIDTGDARPIAQPLRRTPIMLREKIDDEINAMLEMGIIQDSLSDWASPIVAVSKTDGSIHICVDFRRVNEVTRSFEY
ncbi:MAG: hypothetical protein GY820_48605, partial [Gammaproteobacteria bacterium]|nr:hypothetical protein [Gammaproteobacteria bacterium]